MTQDEIRKIENFVLSRPLSEVNDPENLAFLSGLITDHDHLRAKLMSEPDLRRRRAKLDGMRPHLRFRSDTADAYELADRLKAIGVQPIYQEQERVSRIWTPSYLHEVR